MRTIVLLLLYICYTSCTAQDLNLDSLRQLLARSREDTNRMFLLENLGAQYLMANLDSAYYYGSRALTLSRRFQNQRGKSLCQGLIASIMKQTGNYPEALRLNLQALQIAEQTRDELSTVRVFNSLGALYFDENDYHQALGYFFKSLRNCNNQPSFEKETILSNIGDAYQKLHMLDSALQFSNAAYQLSSARSGFTEMGDELTNLGEIYSALNRKQLALVYYRQAIAVTTQTLDFDNFCLCCLGLAKIFASENRRDSALKFAHQSLNAARTAKISRYQLEVYNLIEGIYEANSQVDSSLRYLRLTVALQDSLYSQEKSREFQTMTWQENIRQQDLAAQKKQAEENAVYNMQLIAIAFFIPIFFLFVIFLARIRVKVRVIEFLAVVNLLLLFEFITDVAFPYISEWTHENPIWEMLILVLIAALLEPLNYRIERWIKVKLVRKPDSPSLQTASPPTEA
jgi:tetratricopeptide (TPR) repeat protein